MRSSWCAEKGETVYVNEYYQLQNRSIITKHIFVGTTRITSKLAYYAIYDSPALSDDVDSAARDDGA